MPRQYCKRIIASEILGTTATSVPWYQRGTWFCAFSPLGYVAAIGGGLFLHLATVNLAVWQGSRVVVQVGKPSLMWVKERGVWHERCSMVGKEENLTFCWHHFILNSPDVRKNPLNIYQYSSRIGIDLLCRKVLVRGMQVRFFCWVFIFTAKRKNIQN